MGTQNQKSEILILIKSQKWLLFIIIHILNYSPCLDFFVKFGENSINICNITAVKQ